MAMTVASSLALRRAAAPARRGPPLLMRNVANPRPLLFACHSCRSLFSTLQDGRHVPEPPSKLGREHSASRSSRLGRLQQRTQPRRHVTVATTAWVSTSRSTVASTSPPQQPFQRSILASSSCRRYYSTENDATTPAATIASEGLQASRTPTILPAPRGLTSLASTRALLSISGPDAARYLQGAVTAAVLDAAAGSVVPALSSEGHGPGGIYTAFLNAQGRVLNDVFLYRDRSRRSSGDGSNDSKEGFLIEVDRDQAEMLAAHIKRYRLRAKFDVRVLDPEERSVWAAWDDETAPETLRDVLASSFTTDSDIIILRDDRAPGLCYRIIATGGSSAGPPSLPLSLPIVPETAYRVRRYLAGVAEGQDELVRGQALPHEHNLDVLGVVSGAPPPIDWHKGCYVGQELTIRTRHRGVVRKRVLPCVVYRYGDSQPPPAELAFFHGGSRRTGPQGGGSAESIPPQTSISRIASVSGDGSTDADRLVASGRRGGGAATTRSVGRWLAGYGNVGLALCRLEAMAPDLAQTAIHVDQPGGGASLEGTKAAEDEFVAVWEEDVRKGGETHVAGASDGQDQLQKQRHSVRVKAFVPSWLRKALRDQALAASHPGSATGGHA